MSDTGTVEVREAVVGVEVAHGEGVGVDRGIRQVKFRAGSDLIVDRALGQLAQDGIGDLKKNSGVEYSATCSERVCCFYRADEEDMDLAVERLPVLARVLIPPRWAVEVLANELNRVLHDGWVWGFWA